MTFANQHSYYGWESSHSSFHHNYNLPKILELLPDGAHRILDAGCGNGFIAGHLMELGYDIIGIDVSQDGIDIARKAYPDCCFEVFSVYDDLTEITEKVDVVISSEVIEHLYYPKRFVNNIYTILLPGGSFILTTPYHGYLKNFALSIINQWDKHFTVNWDGGHIKFFSEKTLKSLLVNNGFEKIRFRNAGRLPWLWKSMVCRADKPLM